jgi:hypothetical protein
MSGRRAKFYRADERRRSKPLPTEFTFGYLHPDGGCPHHPPCSPAGSKPYGGNEPGSRCVPQPKQSLAHASPAEILFYGGAVGGGKSEYAIVEAVTLALMHPGTKIAIFRRTLKELKQELVGRLQLLTWAGDKTMKGPNGQPFAKFNATDMYLRLWNGSEIWLCYCEREAHVYKYQSFQIIGLFIDESSHFTEYQVKYLITRVRSPRSGVQKVIRLTSNPGNVGHGWHKRWFIRPTAEELGDRPLPQPFEVWRPLPRDGDRTPPDKILTRQFIPAWFHDNIALQTADPNYLAKVWALGGDKARQLAEGDWDANDSMIVGPFWREHMRVTATSFPLLAMGFKPDQVIPWHIINDRTWRPPVGALIYSSVDYGFGAPWSFHLHAALPGGHTRTFFEFYKAGVRDHEQARMIWRAVSQDVCFAGTNKPVLEGLQWCVYDPAMGGSRQEVGLAKSIIEVYQDETHHKVQFLAGAGGRSARMSRPNRWMDGLSTAADGLPNHTFTTACPEAIRTVPEVPWDEDDREVEDDKSENHAYEDIGRFFEARPHAPRTKPPDPFEHLDPISKRHAEVMAQRSKPKIPHLDVRSLGAGPG